MKVDEPSVVPYVRARVPDLALQFETGTGRLDAEPASLPIRVRCDIDAQRNRRQLSKGTRMWRVTAKARFVQQLDTSALETAMSTLGTVSAARCARRDEPVRIFVEPVRIFVGEAVEQHVIHAPA
ncbi:hypothetical protein K6W16_28645 [Burkholderia dolosa]|uniref:Uncharacterized protein n=1 Tax=Burkholderia dolosa TaxID=152500 RepID=A0A892IBA4_9BURK|nr:MULTISPECIES: hypothetical protein [Burkholderia]MBR8421319.1 hypothetical protein [Burkholderia dolosa]MBY4661039.1 hypothetical protein [Burkholderia dolosa]MBY4692441.1 hypothetical protein [Burkholderia dolosa]MBY4785458.1 hypothetical protein [Burkholderia dolosa]MBY4791055.1 hypothetical protein [Burkholderia dolosa]